MERRKIRVLATGAAALLLLGIGIVFLTLRTPPPIMLDTSGFPTVGKSSAKVEVVLFEDFRCSHCCDFSQEIFPQIKSNYIDAGKVRYTIVPLAFLKGSKPIANAVIAVYRISPAQFVPFLKEITSRCIAGEVLSDAALLKIARHLGSISLPQLQECIENKCYYHELEKNLQLAHKIMGKDFGTPSLYVDGISTSTVSYWAIQSKIESALAKGGKP